MGIPPFDLVLDCVYEVDHAGGVFLGLGGCHTLRDMDLLGSFLQLELAISHG
jgi:hypothetical protein